MSRFEKFSDNELYNLLDAFADSLNKGWSDSINDMMIEVYAELARRGL